MDAKGPDAAQVVVGYTAPYAIYVHEDLQAHHTNGQAKFLSEPLEVMRYELGLLVLRRFKETRQLEPGLWEAGRLLLTESRSLVPVDTGFLFDSGFVRVEAG